MLLYPHKYKFFPLRSKSSIFKNTEINPQSISVMVLDDSSILLILNHMGCEHEKNNLVINICIFIYSSH
ncbi:hypothetical protein Bresa_01902|uniref:Uncharacterized protein n=1 Tax=Brenneria salicis ATCC 15712 = DSM 30166 TaxID=714314 RepID=A0A366I8I0_9GAMM|nr:hypothetical protein [Brenneria salicis ATCC 15712 = DSM 30166]RBP65750.1 hypothetical protein DES54_10414 [Brenneria salicis ATCC 15712 = DSM 30166]